MNELVALLVQNGEMEFGAFVQAARANGLNPALWRRAKQNNLLHTFIMENGDLHIKAGAKPQA